MKSKSRTNRPAKPLSPPPRITVTWGEVADRFSIVTLKLRNARTVEQRAQLRRQLAELNPLLRRILAVRGARTIYERLRATNAGLWKLESQIRQLENPGSLQVALKISKKNDERAALKAKIVELLGGGDEFKFYTKK